MHCGKQCRNDSAGRRVHECRIFGQIHGRVLIVRRIRARCRHPTGKVGPRLSAEALVRCLIGRPRSPHTQGIAVQGFVSHIVCADVCVHVRTADVCVRTAVRLSTHKATRKAARVRTCAMSVQEWYIVDRAAAVFGGAGWECSSLLTSAHRSACLQVEVTCSRETVGRVS